jgi:hypothetical protein
MPDYTNDLIRQYINDNIKVADDEPYPTIDCWEIRDWVDEICELKNIDSSIMEYVDFKQMLLDYDDYEIFVRRKDGTFQNIGYFIPSQTEWNKVAKEYINNNYHSIYVIRTN